MKTSIISILGLAGCLLLSNCTTVEQHPPDTHTSTVEETTVIRPYSSTVETQTTRKY